MLNAEPTSSSISGLEWKIDQDCLQVCRGPNKECPSELTQRVVLSFVSSVFDPMGIFAPFTMRMRKLLKSIWIHHGQSWDEMLNEEVKQIFMDWINETQTILETFLPRRAETDAGNEVSFLLGNFKIAPNKQLSIPRLGLQAALCSVLLNKLSLEKHDLLKDSATHWTDSITVLQWLHSEDRKQKVFVANKAAKILQASTIDGWKHIKGKLNPSDIGTRSITSEKLSESDWLSGPNWLKDQSEKWLISSALVSSVIEYHTQVAEIANNSMVGDSQIGWNRFSSFSKCVRAIAHCLRLKYKSQSKVLTSDEMQPAEERELKLIQIETFSDFCNGKEGVKKTNIGRNLAKFSPFSDEKGLIRIRGRIKHANLSFEQRNPILLSTKHEMVKLMLRGLHQEHNHERVEYVRRVLQQKY